MNKVTILILLALCVGCSKKATKLPPAIDIAPISQPTVAETQTFPEEVSPVQQPITVSDVVYFAFDSDVLAASETLKIDMFLRRAQVSGAMSLRLVGGACPIGASDYNYALGQRRAEAVQAYILANSGGFNLSLKSVGEGSLVSDDPSTFGLNRRCEITVD